MKWQKAFSFCMAVCITLFTAFLPGSNASAMIDGSGQTAATAPALSSTFDCSTVSEIPVQECQILVTLYTTTNGPGWTNHTGWLENNTPCSWYGIYCDSGHVAGIREYGNNLQGPIPVDITKLTELTSLNFFGNGLTGTILPEFGNMTKLTGLWLGVNNLTGSIPPELGKLTAMESINIAGNNLTGQVPPEIGNLTNLTELAIDANPLSGLLPTTLTNLPLDFFDYSRTNLCEPSDPAFQNWLAGVSYVGRLQVTCVMAPATYSVSGLITDNHNIPQAGVTVSAGGSVSAVTGSDGTYTLAGLAPGSYTLTPSKTGAAFIPPTIALTVTSANITGQNFVLTAASGGPCSASPFGDANGNPLMQTAPSWGSIPYGGAYKLVNGKSQFVPFYLAKTDNIAYWGCYLTSTAMIINYYAQKQGVVWRTDPKDLNSYLQNTPGGYSTDDPSLKPGDPKTWIVTESYVNGYAAAKYARDHGVKIAYWSYLAQGKDETDSAFMARLNPLVTQALCSNTPNPVILGVTNKTSSGLSFQHYIAGVGKTSTSWNVSDPLRTGPTTLADNYSNTYNQVDFFSAGAQPKFLSVGVHSPVEVMLTDAQGHRAGMDPTTGQSYSEIPSSTYNTISLSADDDSGVTQSMKRLDILSPASGPYTLKVTGTGSGHYSLDIYASDPNGDGQLRTISGEASKGKVDTFTIGLPTAPGAPPAVVQSLRLYLPIMGR